MKANTFIHIFFISLIIVVMFFYFRGLYNEALQDCKDAYDLRYLSNHSLEQTDWCLKKWQEWDVDVSTKEERK